MEHIYRISVYRFIGKDSGSTMNHKFISLSLLSKIIPVAFVIVLFASACAPASTPATLMPISTKEISVPTTVTTTTPPDQTGDPQSSGPVNAAKQDLAEKLGIDSSKIVVVSIEAVEWPNSCLGVLQKDVYCAQMITPGYQIVLQAEGQTYEYHTNKSGSGIILASGSIPNGRQPIIVYHREGGIAGFCDDVMIFASGNARISSCKLNKEKDIALSPAQMNTINQWMQSIKYFNYEHTDPATADAMTISLKFSGHGQSQASDAEVQAILSLLSQIAIQ
jgi:hypothetical protein